MHSDDAATPIDNWPPRIAAEADSLEQEVGARALHECDRHKSNRRLVKRRGIQHLGGSQCSLPLSSKAWLCERNATEPTRRSSLSMRAPDFDDGNVEILVPEAILLFHMHLGQCCCKDSEVLNLRNTKLSLTVFSTPGSTSVSILCFIEVTSVRNEVTSVCNATSWVESWAACVDKLESCVSWVACAWTRLVRTSIFRPSE
mmetsp:Transcript_49089/g.98437  ORF Transcript_49089/g.98437 Transcript_49089/m.98437 type:complete len:201 (+) Transcript_49089:327-929(+)